jgi:hypothetical protein
LTEAVCENQETEMGGSEEELLGKLDEKEAKVVRRD